MKDPKYLDRSPCYYDLKYGNDCMECDKAKSCTFHTMIQCFKEEENQRNMEIYQEKYHDSAL